MNRAEKQGIALTYIQPGKPQQNAYLERYNRTVRHEWVDLYIFETIDDVQQIATEWLWTYNNERPNKDIGGVTPAMKLKMAAPVLQPRPVKTGRITIRRDGIEDGASEVEPERLSGLGVRDRALDAQAQLDEEVKGLLHLKALRRVADHRRVPGACQGKGRRPTDPFSGQVVQPLPGQAAAGATIENRDVIIRVILGRRHEQRGDVPRRQLELVANAAAQLTDLICRAIHPAADSPVAITNPLGDHSRHIRARGSIPLPHIHRMNNDPVGVLQVKAGGCGIPLVSFRAESNVAQGEISLKRNSRRLICLRAVALSSIAATDRR